MGWKSGIWGASRRPAGERVRPQPQLLISVILVGATLLLILSGTNFLASAGKWAGESAKINLIMVMLNVALIIAGLRRLADIQHENERRLDAERRALLNATLADRDKIQADDHVQIVLSTFNDSRQAFVFAVNPLGVQADGTLNEGQGVQRGSGTLGSSVGLTAGSASATRSGSGQKAIV